MITPEVAPDGTRGEPSTELRALRLSVVAYVAVLAIKLIAYSLSGVLALLAEALHTLGDIVVSGFLLLALWWSRKEPDERHQFGYGRAQSAAALVAATLFISFTALRLYEEAIPRLFRSESVDYDNVALAVAVLVASMAIAAAPLAGFLRNRSRGPAANAQMWELVNDELGLIAALVGTSLAVAGQTWADPLAAVVIATIITVKAISLFRENLCFLIGRAPDRQVVDAMRTAVVSVPGVTGVHDIRGEYVAPEQLHLDMHIEVAPGTPIEQADQIAAAARDAVHQFVTGAYCVIHVDPNTATPPAPRRTHTPPGASR